MKKESKDQTISRLSKENKNLSISNDNIGCAVFLLLILTMIFGICLMGSFNRNDELKQKLDLISYRYDKLVSSTELKNYCSKLKEVSNLDFKYDDFYNSCYGIKSNIQFTNIKEIENAITHYKLGNKK